MGRTSKKIYEHSVDSTVSLECYDTDKFSRYNFIMTMREDALDFISQGCLISCFT